jgi:hypothetical protein
MRLRALLCATWKKPKAYFSNDMGAVTSCSSGSDAAHFIAHDRPRRYLIDVAQAVGLCVDILLQHGLKIVLARFGGLGNPAKSHA